jgi:hypothetical protein
MDKNKFWLGGRLFNTASPRLGAPTQRKVRPQDGRPNATQGTSASWAPQRNARHVRKLGAPTQRKARLQLGRPPTSATQTRKLGAPTQRKARPQVGRPNAQHKARPQGSTSLKANARDIRPHQVGAQCRPQVGHVRKLGAQGNASWAPQRNARHVRKMVAQTQNSSATKTSTQGSTRLKDELEDG